MHSEPAIVVARLRHAYGARVAVEDVSFQVERGRIFALLGPNGAGKTTTLEILEGYRDRQSGAVSVLGRDPARQASVLRERVGVMPQQVGIYPQLRPREALELYAGFYPHPRDPEQLIRLVGLEGSLKQRFRYLSGGQQQRLSLALALVGRPELVFLDEPTTGMDPQARRATWDLIRQLKDDGVTVVLTTHLMDEAEQLADEIAIINHGRIVAQGSPSALMAMTGATQIRFRTNRPVDTGVMASALGAPVVATNGSGYELIAEPSPALVAAVAAALHQQDLLLTELRVGNPSLEEAFLEITRSTAENTA